MRWMPLAPPRLPAPDALAWVFERAFAQSGGVGTAVTGAPELAEALELSPRIAHRCSWQQLAADLDETIARRWTLQLLQRRGANRVLAQAMDAITERAKWTGVDLLWLKHAALRASALVQEGQRDARDIDMLLHSSAAPAFHEELRSIGFQPLGEAQAGRPPPPLVNAQGACVELHTDVPGIEARVFWSHRDGMLPRRDVLAAHALVHGLLQHLTSPESYAPVRVLADAIDLRIWELPPDTLLAHAPGLDEPTVVAAQKLAQGLFAGEMVPVLVEDPATAMLLRHVVAASVDPDYRAALAAQRIGELAKAGDLLRGLQRLLLGGSSTARERRLKGTSMLERLRKARLLLRGSFTLMKRRLRPP